jgi:hypothetical protein
MPVPVPRQARTLTLLLTVLLASAAFAVSAQSASAGGIFEGKLPPYSWTAYGPEETLHVQVAKTGTPDASICVGPVTYSGGTYHFPYGWKCELHSVGWNYTGILAHAGVKNPNPIQIKFYEEHL